MEKKIGRNDPCPCGSGKKYKSCCMNKQTEQKKVYSLSGKRKFKAKVIDSSSGASEVFAKAGGSVPSAATDPNVIEKLKIRMTDHDYRTKNDTPKETKQVEPPPSEQEVDRPAPKYLPGDDLHLSDEDFRVDQK